MANVLIYTSPWCGFCYRAKALLDQKEVTYQEIDVTTDASLRMEMMQKSGRRTVPQIFINDASIGGCDDLYALERAGKLDPLLAA